MSLLWCQSKRLSGGIFGLRQSKLGRQTLNEDGSGNWIKRRREMLLWHLDCFLLRNVWSLEEHSAAGMIFMSSFHMWNLLLCCEKQFMSALFWILYTCVDILYCDSGVGNNDTLGFLVERTVHDSRWWIFQLGGCFSKWNCTAVWQSLLPPQVWRHVQPCLGSGV